MSTSMGQISAWGNGLAFRLTKPQAKAAGVGDGSQVRVTVEPKNPNVFSISPVMVKQ